MLRYEKTRCICAPRFFSAIILILVCILALGIFLIAVLTSILILILVIHDISSELFICGSSATLAYPIFQDLSFALKKTLARSPEKIAVVIPAAQDFKPPEKIPRKPSD